MDFSTALKLLSKAPVDPCSSVALGTLNEFLNFGTQIHGVDQQTRDLLSMTHLVASNIKEANRLRRLKYALLDPGELTWMDRVIEETGDALKNIAELLEPARVDKELRGDVDSINKIMWVIKENPKVAEMHARLAICHQSLMGVIPCLHAKGAVLVNRMPEEHAAPYDPQMERFLNWKTQRKRRKTIVSTDSGRSFGQRSSTSSASAITSAATSKSPSATSSRSLASMRSSSPTSPCMVSLPELDESTFVGFDPFKRSNSDSTAGNLPESEAQRSGFGSGEPFVRSTSSVPESDIDSFIFQSKDYFSHSQAADMIPPAQAATSYQGFYPSSNTLNIDGHPVTSTTNPNSAFEFADGLQIYNPHSLYHNLQVLEQETQAPAMITSQAPRWLYPQDPAVSLSQSSGAGSDPSLDYARTTVYTQNGSPASVPTLQTPAKQPWIGRSHSDGFMSVRYEHGPTEHGALTTTPERPSLSGAGRRTVSSGRRTWMAYHAARHCNEYDKGHDS